MAGLASTFQWPAILSSRTGTGAPLGDDHDVVLGDLIGADDGDPALRHLELVARLEPLDPHVRGEAPHPLDGRGGSRLASQ